MSVGVGDIIEEKYLIEALLSPREPVSVVRAKHLQLGMSVAIKLIRADRVGDPGAARRLIREARAAALLRSPHAVRILDIEQMRDGNLLLHFPHDDFEESVERFLHEAAEDPAVISIMITVYRTSKDSAVVAALRTARARGKDVTAVVRVTFAVD